MRCAAAAAACGASAGGAHEFEALRVLEQGLKAVEHARTEFRLKCGDCSGFTGAHRGGGGGAETHKKRRRRERERVATTHASFGKL